MTVLHGDCIAVMRGMAADSVDAIVTDPPYGLGFMGKAWDDLPPGEEWARECLRVLKPGGHMLAFGGTRTWHRLAVAVEDAGFEIRDSIAWLYGSGFPKSLDVGKAIDKLDAADERRVRNLMFTGWMRSTGIHAAQINDITTTNMGNHYLTDKEQPAIATADLFDLLRPYLPPVPAEIEELVRMRTVESKNYAARPITQDAKESPRSGDVITFDQRSSKDRERRDIAHTDAARQWQGWGTALKPAFEPIVVARKPLVGTVAVNVQAHGTGGLNIDACRIGDELRVNAAAGNKPGGAALNMSERGMPQGVEGREATGRWPANVILDDDQAAALDAQSGVTKDGVAVQRNLPPEGSKQGAVKFKPSSKRAADFGYGGQGGASRFFYCAKAPKNERPKVDGVAHPTVKPLSLMRWLVRLVTPPGGTVLDPFAGSGTTLEAATLEGFDVIGIEREAEYLPLINMRVARASATEPTPDEPVLFGDAS
jgi:DNA modification methylase